MKKLIAGVLVLTILGSCGNKKTNIDPFASITQEVDSIRHKADSDPSGGIAGRAQTDRSGRIFRRFYL